MAEAIKKVVIAGGGTAGWMAAAAISTLIGKNLEITLIESDAIPVVGVGEATIPPLISFHRLLRLDEATFMRETNATFKLGINFENWRSPGHEYFHSFGTTGKDCWAATFHNFWMKGAQDNIASSFEEYCLEIQAARQQKFAHFENNALNYAYHLDASLYAALLRRLAEQAGVLRVEGKIIKVNSHQDNGFIESVGLEGGREIPGDFFIDCTGFRALLIEKTLKSGFEDWSHWLPCDQAIAVQSKSDAVLPPYTRSIAHECGWRWQIPLQNRVGNGFVYCSDYLDSDQATQLLLDSLATEAITEPRTIVFKAGKRRKQWLKNCVAIGLSSGFIEPLESTSIHLIQRSIIRLMQLFPSSGVSQVDVDEYNRQADRETDYIRDFIILHYFVTQRRDSQFWRHCASMDIPQTLKNKIELFKRSGRIFRADVDLFAENSWVQVMMGQGIVPEQYHIIADMMTDNEQRAFLNGIRASIARSLVDIPSHKNYLQKYCAVRP